MSRGSLARQGAARKREDDIALTYAHIVMAPTIATLFSMTLMPNQSMRKVIDGWRERP
jgi:hypothetical protein